MNPFQKMVALLLSICLAAFGLSAIAAKPGPTKTYSMGVDDSHVTYVTGANNLQVLDVSNGGAPIFVKIKNESPPSDASSNINSFSFTVKGMSITSLDKTACESLGGMCALDTTTNTVTVTNISPPIQAKGIYTVSLKVNSCGDGVWSANVYTGSQLTGQSFGFIKDDTLPSNTETNVSCGDAACNMSFTVPDSLAATNITGLRGLYNKDGSTCSTVDYFATNTIPINKTLHFAWDATSSVDDTSQVGATFRYTVTFPNPGRPQLAWHTDSLGPVFVDAQPCLVTQFDHNLPAPYGTLAQDVNSTKNKISVNVTTPPSISLPFPIIVESERMNVTAIGPSQWTVERHQGGTAPQAHNASPTVFIMSTPRPLLTGPFVQRQLSAGYKVGDQAHGCVASPVVPPTDLSAWDSTTTFDIIDIDDIWSLGR